MLKSLTYMTVNYETAPTAFTYWNMRRKGIIQSEIARHFGISRQAVNRSIHDIERIILSDLLEMARSSDVMVDWTSAVKGVLVGSSRQLGGLYCLIIIDDSGRPRVFYDTRTLGIEHDNRAEITKIKDVIRRSLGLELRDEMTFRSILGSLYG